jgi:HD-like signal output (HDOD) protein
MIDFWTHSIHCAVLCRLLAKSSAVLHADRLFLAGLLHDIGSLVIYQKIPQQASQVLLTINHDRRLLSGIEQEIIGFTHADVGRALLKLWSLPESLYEVVGCYRDPELAQTHKLDAHILNLATRLLENAQQGKSAEDVLAEMDDQELAVVRLSREQIVLISEQAAADFFEVFEMLSPGKQFNQGKTMPN